MQNNNSNAKVRLPNLIAKRKTLSYLSTYQISIHPDCSPMISAQNYPNHPIHSPYSPIQLFISTRDCSSQKKKRIINLISTIPPPAPCQSPGPRYHPLAFNWPVELYKYFSLSQFASLRLGRDGSAV